MEFLLPELPQWLFRLTVLTEHLLIGWISAVPLLWLLRRERHPDVRRIVVCGFVYGSAYYLLINAWLLPLAFGDPYPLQMGFSTVIPSLVVHVVYGLSLSGYVIWRRTAESLPS